MWNTRPRQRSSSALSLFLTLLFVVSSLPGFALEISGPGLVVTSLECKVSPKDLPTDTQERAFQWFVNGALATEGRAVPTALKPLSHTFSTSGKQTVKLVYGELQSETALSCLWGWLALLPPVVAIILALLSREVLSSLLMGVWCGGFLLHGFNPFTGLLRALDTYVVGGLADSAHASIVIFSITIGGMIGILNRTGGMQGIVDIISKMVVGPRTAQVAAWIMGIVIFFDDYANTLIVGNSMRPITDKNGVSREKLSYIVDSTSAPVAGVALLSTWIGYEIGLIRQAFIDLQIPETNFYGVFLQTIPFRFYCLLTLFFGLVICLTTKEFGPMWAAEKRALTEGKPLADGANPISTPESAMPVLPADMPKRWYNAAIPILVVIGGTLVGLLGHGGCFASHQNLAEIHSVMPTGAAATGLVAVRIDHVQTDMGIIAGRNHDGEYLKVAMTEQTVLDGQTGDKARSAFEAFSGEQTVFVKPGDVPLPWGLRLRSAFGDADSTKVLVWVSVLGSMMALFLGMAQGLIKLEQGVQAWVSGARSMLLAMCVLVLAWAINGVCKDLHTADFIVALVRGSLTPWAVPAIVFLVSCAISFATGTSWGTMAIMLPISIPLAYHLNLDAFHANPSLYAGWTEIAFVKNMMLVSIGAVLEGSIFGDHCSPISDTTIMSSMASGSDHIDHVRTQAPYAVTVALVSLLICYIPAGFGFNPFVLIPSAMVALVIILNVLGTDVNATPIQVRQNT